MVALRILSVATLATVECERGFKQSNSIEGCSQNIKVNILGLAALRRMLLREHCSRSNHKKIKFAHLINR